jgi:LPS sulfotransferase NodH/glycosyltransferase involved in cell wall biosynthesis
MKISVITPSCNSGSYIETAIQSILAQDYTNYEHIVIDGGSADNTLEILKHYSHLKWISEPDGGQVHAMNKGFGMSSGDIIVYLNADDYFLNGAFSTVIPHFQSGEKIVMGKVLVKTERSEGVKEWINDPKTDFDSMLRHWEPNAFCVNPVGYFYLRQIQEKFPYNVDNDDKQDLEFLLEIARCYKIKKIDHLLGVFNNLPRTKTAAEQLYPTYWRHDNFPFINRLLENNPPEYFHKFQLDRDRGYMLRRYWTAQEAFEKSLAKGLFKKQEIFLFPEDEGDTGLIKGNFVENNRLVMKGDWVIPVLTMGNVASRSVHQALKNVSHEILPAQVYHLHTLDDQLCRSNLPKCMPHFSVGLALGHAYLSHRNDVKWKFVTGVRDPIGCGLSALFQNAPHKASTSEIIKNHVIGFCNYAASYFDNEYKDFLGLDILSLPFEKDKGYTCIVIDDNVEVLIYKFESLPNIFSRAMEEYFGIEGLDLPSVNLTSNKSCSAAYENAKHTIRFEEKLLNKIYSSRLVHHFYSNNEVDTFFSKWTTTHHRTINICLKPSHKDYIIFFVPRCGSTLLTDLILQTGQMGNPIEWFNPHSFAYINKLYGYDPTNFDNYIHKLLTEQRSDNGVFGAEIEYSQLNKFFAVDKIWDYFDIDNTKIIFLNRKDKVKQAVSFYRAMNTGLWHSRTPQTQPVNSDIKYDVHLLKNALTTIINLELNLEKFFIKYNISPLRLSYEYLLSSHQSAVQSIATQIGMNLSIANSLVPKTTKLSDQQSKFLVNNFRHDADDYINCQLRKLENVK